MVLKTDRLTAAIEFYSELLPTWWCSGAKKILLRYAIVEVGLVDKVRNIFTVISGFRRRSRCRLSSASARQQQGLVAGAVANRVRCVAVDCRAVAKRVKVLLDLELARGSDRI